MHDSTIKAIIVDDEPGSVFTLKALVEEYCPEVQVISTSENPLEAIEQIKILRPDLVFLDIEMPYANAFDLLDSLKPVTFEVIFTTAFNEYALKAFKYAAVDYLLKPVSISELKESVQRVKKVFKVSEGKNERVDVLLNNLRNPKESSGFLSLPSLKGMDFVELNKVIYIEASGNYSEINFGKGKKLIVTKSLKDLEDLLPEENFYRIHHSYIVNISHVSKYLRGRGGQVVLSDGTPVTVAVRKKIRFLDLLKKIKSNRQGNS